MTLRAPHAPQRSLVLLALALLSSSVVRAASVGTAFTYQGQLQNAGVPQNGPCDFRFKLFDALTSGSQVGSTQTLSSVGVANGLFTVSIDFGSLAFSGSARWLETGVACPSGGSFTTLAPRQAMAPAPNAIFAESASVFTDGSTLTGNGTGAAPLALANPLGLLQNSGTATITGTNFGTGAGVYGSGAGGYGLYGVSALSVAVFGDSTGSDGVHGHTTSGPAAGVAGVNESFGAGVYGQSNGGGAGLYGNGTTSGDGVYGRGDGLNGVEGYSAFNTGVRGNSGNGYGVWGSSSTFDGVHGDTSSNYSAVAGVNGASGDGVYGYAAGDSSPGDGNGVHAVGTLTCSIEACGPAGSYALLAEGVVRMTDYVAILGDLDVVGVKNFVMPHPTDASKEIVFTALEGPESGTYFRGTTRLLGGYAEVAVPESFRLVSSEQGLTVVATPVGAPAMIVCMSRSLDKIVFQGSADVEFDYMVNGIRAGYENREVILPNRTFVPRRASDRSLAALPPETVRRLKASKILNDDGTVNEETARRMGWDKRANWNSAEPQRNR
ncbi:MAG TPA: hypothetical protein VN032_01265 [Thermoanaerobaculia bacterium]|jgi:hypothetical protein|nr:hypothetical protein [Thermoanaerobaculia bacterium]